MNDHEKERRRILELADPPVDRNVPESRRIAAAARTVGQLVLAGWTTALRGGIAQGIEAQIAAAALGYKPLYFDPWPEEEARKFARLIRAQLPVGAEVHGRAEGLFIYRPEAVRPILDCDPDFYRPHSETDLDAIVRTCKAGVCGELLGYGARSLWTLGAAKVTVFGQSGARFVFFVSRPEVALKFARLRAGDLAAVADERVFHSIEFAGQP